MEDRQPSMISNESLSIEIKNLSVQLSELKVMVGNSSSIYISHDVFELRMREIDVKMAEINTNIKRISSGRWVQNTLSIILGGALAILIEFFLTHLTT